MTFSLSMGKIISLDEYSVNTFFEYFFRLSTGLETDV